MRHNGEQRPARDASSLVPSGARVVRLPVRVLVVDDNIDAADCLADLLQLDLGTDVRVAYDGPAALEMAAAFRPQVVLLDIGLPEMDGYEVARRLRATELDAVLVALTGYGREQDRQRSAEAGFRAHLIKPPDLNALRRILAGVDPSGVDPSP